MFPADRLSPKKLLLWAAPLAALACGGDGGTDVVVPSLTITAVTTGLELDPDGYSVSIDGQAARALGVQATLPIEGLTDGQHSVQLSGVAPNCAIAGENPRAVSVAAGATARMVFDVACGAATGVLQVFTVTTGTGTDPDGFAVLLDGVDRGAIPVAGNISLSGLGPGPHSVGLTRLAANCQVSGDNPRVVTVVAGETLPVDFAIACIAPGSDIGSLEITISTSGRDPDPDGYQLVVDNGAGQPVLINTLVPIPNLSATTHTVQLLGVASNCTITGGNTVRVAVPSGGTAQFGFVVVCSLLARGSIQVSAATSGTPSDGDGYTVSIDAGAPRTLQVNGNITVANLVPGTHSVQLGGLAPNCQVTGGNPVGVDVAVGETAAVAFAISCGATLGQLAVTISGLSGVDAAVTVTGPNNFSRSLTGTQTIPALTPGNYAVAAANVTSGGTTYTASVSQPSVAVVAGGSAAVSVSYSPVGASLDLRIVGLYLTQSTQDQESSVPLVAGRDAFLRVFVVANQANSAKPRVRVQLSGPGGPLAPLTIDAPGASTPTQMQEGVLTSSWNARIPGAQIQRGLSIVADVDPTTAIAESNEGNNRFPASGTKGLIVQSVPPARIRFISVQQGTLPPGNVSNANKDQLTELARRVYPLSSIDADVDPLVFTASEPLNPDGAGWGQLLSDLNAKRVDEGTDRTYYGVVKLGYNRLAGLVGLTLDAGIPTSAGWDEPSDASRVVAHELGHTWNQLHTPCDHPPDIDQGYPYGNGIGVYGFDVTAGSLKPPTTTPDIMGYCLGPWISEYTYRRVMTFRGSSATTSIAAVRQPALLVWGRIVNGRPVLEPAFEVVTQPRLPSRPGPYSVTATTADGSRAFTISFDAPSAADDPQGTRHFAFAVPLNPGVGSRVASLRLSGAGAAIKSPSTVSPQPQGEALARSIVARREGENVSLRWDAAAHPMIMVRDPDTGEILSFARGGSALVRTSKSALDLDVSDGVRSQRVRLAINRS